MVWLAAGIFAMALLYWWLIGHWFARVLMCPLIMAPVVLALDPVLALFVGGPNHPLAIIWLIGCVIAAWFLSGIPKYVRNYHAARLYSPVTRMAAGIGAGSGSTFLSRD